MDKTILQSATQRFDTLDDEGLRENKPEYIVLHSTRNYPEFEDLLEYHRTGKAFAGMGYHLFIADSREVTQGRSFDLEGAHALGFNTNSVGLSIYSPDGKLRKKKIDQVRRVIGNLNDLFGELEVVPHSYAQAVYNNGLLEKYGFDRIFPENIEIVNEELFSELKIRMDDFLGGLRADEYPDLKDALKRFKNCPGAMFNHFI